MKYLLFTILVFTLPASADTWAERLEQRSSQLPDAEGYQLQKVNTFGGDDRERAGKVFKEKSLRHYEELAASGSIKCNGEVVGSAQIIEPSNADVFKKDTTPDYAIGVTVAHVLLDDSGNRKQNCYYCPLNRGNLKFKIKKIEAGRESRTGKQEDDWGAFVLEEDVDEMYGAFRYQSKTEVNLKAFQDNGGQIILSGYNFNTDKLSITRKNCGIVVKQRGHFFYGNNKLYLNSCDSDGGSSGGALLANYKDNLLLLGVQIGGYDCYIEKPYGEPFDTKNNVNITVLFHEDFINGIKTLIYEYTGQMPDIAYVDPYAVVTTQTTALFGRYKAIKSVNLRAGPATSYSKVGRLQAGETFEPLGKVIGKNWIKVAKNGKAVGYVYASLVEPAN